MWSKGHMIKQAWQKEKACARSPCTLFYIKVRSFETLKIGEKIDFSIQIHIQNCQTSKVEHFSKIVNSILVLSIFAKHSILAL